MIERNAIVASYCQSQGKPQVTKQVVIVKTALIAVFSMVLTGCATQTVAPVMVSGQTVVFQGMISASTANEFLRLTEKHDAKRVLIASGGGHVEPAIRMARVIHERGMDVEVFGNCFSSCANYIFPAGKGKSITALGLVGWHGNMHHLLYLHRTGEVPIAGAWLDEVAMLAKLETEFFQTIGVDPFVTWFGKIAPYKVPDTYFLDVDDMARFGIGNVSARADYASSDLSSYNASGAEKVRFVKVNWDTLPQQPLTSP